MSAFELKVWRLHPQGITITRAERSLRGEAPEGAVKYCGPFVHANECGFWVFPPVDLEITWLGGKDFQYRVLNDWPADEIPLVRKLLKFDDSEECRSFVLDFTGRTKVNCGNVDGNICQIWTGCILQTPPGWALHIRSPINIDRDAPYHVQEGILETDWLRTDIWLNLAFKRPNVPVVVLRDQWPPLAQLVPVRRESYADDWKITEQLLHREDEASDGVFLGWADYNYRKFLRLSPGQEKDSTTYHRERSRLLYGRTVAAPRVRNVTPASKPKSLADIVSASVTAGGLFEQAEGLLRRRVEAYPQDLHAIRMLAHMCRAQGKLDAALPLYCRVTEQDPADLLARDLYTILRGEEGPVPHSSEKLRPSPFVAGDDYLLPEQHEEILALACEHTMSMTRSRVGDSGRIDLGECSSWRLLTDTIENCIPWFAAGIRAMLGQVCGRLGIQNGKFGKIELRLDAHLAGGFYKVHRDNSEQSIRGRKITFTYYFHRQPKKFSGGDLLLYDTSVEQGDYGATFTRIALTDNRIIFFPSSYFHQVTQVGLDDGDATFGLFALNGYIHEDSSAAI